MKTKQAFTLIELLMVISIIGVLAGILIPTVGAVRKQANIAASKSQLSNYVTAMTVFKSEYGYFPLATGTADSKEIKLDDDSKTFIETLSGRDATSGDPVAVGGNRRGIAFLSFSESELYRDDSDDVVLTKLSDRFNNPNIVIVVDTDGNGYVSPKGPTSNEGRIKTAVTAYVSNPEDDDNFEVYKLWD